MNHATTVMWLLVATLGLAYVAGSDTPRAGWAFVNGFGLGAAASIRPLDAFAFALPAAAWLLLLAKRDKRRWIDVDRLWCRRRHSFRRHDVGERPEHRLAAALRI